ncbi:invasion associated locus B family protein [Rhizobiaceae bacterium BDR2-2]|uniref:Invasion associated locus B family protein n=1 Tax=Ectorhizobium quercum TaxID=2965071 RepID=A0AAE3MVJ2_9HYPH|nr:invasion associated locus B family protein [Ectorhizobium quercum]MCX8995973.1 invasion associated locus B family protein [Ectorhizobium quercum]
MRKHLLAAATVLLVTASAQTTTLAQDAPDDAEPAPGATRTGRLPSAQDAGGEILRFPGGATAITETHDDWTVLCEALASGRSCVASQTLGTKESRRPILSAEVSAKPQGAANMLLTMPFGLDLRQGVRLNLDGEKLVVTLPFSVCPEQGCLVSIDIDQSELAQFKAGNAIQLTAIPADSEEPLTFTVSLKGFASALDRSIDLVK